MNVDRSSNNCADICGQPEGCSGRVGKRSRVAASVPHDNANSLGQVSPTGRKIRGVSTCHRLTGTEGGGLACALLGQVPHRAAAQDWRVPSAANAIRHSCAAIWRWRGAVGRATAEWQSGGLTGGLPRGAEVRTYHVALFWPAPD